VKTSRPDPYVDDHGTFTVLVRDYRGQVSLVTALPGVTRGNHWHVHKHEKFIVLSGHATVNLRHVDSTDVESFDVTGDDVTVVDIPTHYVHNIVNTGTDVMTFVVWASEQYDVRNPDTFVEVA
jgi:UDP-2-acetamido-2,6-beta-L-arabino-hexul-4-ose reductase